MIKNTSVAVFGGGCFWCTEAIFKMLKGVTTVEPGYTGGESDNPTYHEVAAGKSGHAEVIRIYYDPKVIPYKTLLTVFFATHDPTTWNRQGADVGTQYRSAIFYTSEDQKTTAQQFITDLNNSTEKGRPIVTEVVPLKQFFPAEDDHKNYYARNPMQPYCQVVISPKLEKVRKQFTTLLKQSSHV
ncbi:MAG: peptide-methionine (S)-S-oxide reductase MsrA [Candidatus Kerfeldbacteria bacterium]|nr:peptide-methionine (S)-S-oxide reductase MsrA [Candidatus Kerfeldbacteria bacterium]